MKHCLERAPKQLLFQSILLVKLLLPNKVLRPFQQAGVIRTKDEATE
ncbi:MAG TPA: hypothetical protein VF556_18920 [Pyrinomonadaceae bacterium]|jgi:hypothetical protein